MQTLSPPTRLRTVQENLRSRRPPDDRTPARIAPRSACRNPLSAAWSAGSDNLGDGSARAIDARNLTARDATARGIRNVSLEIPRGERLGFLGPIGAGKTTFIRLCLGLLRPSSSSVAAQRP